MSNIVKNTTLVSVLDLLAPYSCRGCGRVGTVLCDRCKNYIVKTHTDICPICKTTSNHGRCTNCQNLPPIYIIGERSDILDAIIHDYKYNSVRAFSKPLAEIIDTVTPQFQEKVTIVPLPTVSHHIRKRGFDHTYLLAKKFAHIRKANIQRILIRANNTTQVGSNRSKRLVQAKTAYKLNSKLKINQNTTYVLLDDVWTTGASMMSAYNTLLKAGIKKITIIILALSQ